MFDYTFDSLSHSDNSWFIECELIIELPMLDHKMTHVWYLTNKNYLFFLKPLKKLLVYSDLFDVVQIIILFEASFNDS